MSVIFGNPNINQVFPENWKAQLELIEPLVAEGRSDEASAILDQIAGLPSDPESKRFAARAFGILDPAKGIKILDGIILNDPSDAAAYFDRGVLYYQSGKMDLALRQYMTATKFDPSLADPVFAKKLASVSFESC